MITEKTVTTAHSLAETQKYLDEAIVIVRRKIEYRLKQKGSGLFIDKHQIAGIIDEELRELKDGVHSNDLANIESETTDIAVAAIWGLASMIADDPQGGE